MNLEIKPIGKIVIMGIVAAGSFFAIKHYLPKKSAETGIVMDSIPTVVYEYQASGFDSLKPVVLDSTLEIKKTTPKAVLPAKVKEKKKTVAPHKKAVKKEANEEKP